ncbi:hypothetical protein MRX96_028197 [Rhipicephalus microplus]
MLPNKTRRKSKSGRRRGSKKDDPFASTVPDDAEGVSPTLRERDMESACTIDLATGLPFQGAPTGKQKPLQQPPLPAQPAPYQPPSIMATKREKKRHRHHRRRKESRTVIDEGTKTTAAAVPTEAPSSGTVAGTSGEAAAPKRKGAKATEQVSPVLQGATASAGSLLGGTHQMEPASHPPVMGTSLGSLTAAPTSSYLPEYQSGMPAAAAQQVTGPGPVADFGNMVPSGSHQQATTALTTPVAASVPPQVPPVQDILQKIDEACAVLRELSMQQSSREPSTSNAVGHQHTPARNNCGLQQPSASLGHMPMKLTQISNTQMTQDEDEPSASEVEEKAMFPSTLKVDSHASKIHTKNFTRFRETPANAQEQLSAALGIRTVPANSVVISPDVASKLVSVLNTVENLASGIASRSGHENVKSLHSRNGASVGANLCASCKVTEKKERDSLVDADQLSDDGSNEDEDGVPGRKHKHKTKHRPARTNRTKYNAHEESVEQNEWDYEEGLSGNETEREDHTEHVASTTIPPPTVAWLLFI